MSRTLIINQDRDEILDHELLWSRGLRGDTISTVEHVATGVTLMTSPAASNTTKTTTYWVKDVIGKAGKIVTTIVTTGGRTMQKTAYFHEVVS
ncbi:MAG: hypothetical protein V7727_02210 [Sneathiella sp.]